MNHLEKKNNNLEKLSYIETINKFIKSFSEEFNNLISRENSEIKTIDFYLNENKAKLNFIGEEKSPLKILFEKYFNVYKKIINSVDNIHGEINESYYVINILNNEIENKINKSKNDNFNNDKNEIKRSTINKLYNHLIDIQKNFLNQIINNYNEKKEKIEEDNIIKNSINQIIKETPIQLATQEDIFLLKYNDGVIRSFEDFFCNYS